MLLSKRDAEITSRQIIHVNGIVQGVGFRPFVCKLARHYHLTGFVTNTTHGVKIEIEGEQVSLDRFFNDLKSKAPPLAQISEVTSKTIDPINDESFEISSSETQGQITTLVSPDVAVCGECLGELFDPTDRRYLYPFINCTNCGPRYTIIENIPYDRAATSMRDFTMCDSCQEEFNAPDSRRFHAQPNCCPVCGPEVKLYTGDGKEEAVSGDAIRAVVDILQRGNIAAIKGIGGFHLAVDAINDEAVARLRRRKGREEKPFAVMVGDLESAGRICYLTGASEHSLLSAECPIVLAEKKTGHSLSNKVAPGNDMFGVMLPYTPLHHLLFHNGLKALVMTSGNYSEEPICIENSDAFERLGNIADYFLVHNRDIYLRSDDSIVIQMGGQLRSVRRSRGYAPRPVSLHNDGPPLLAIGGELKNNVCLLKDKQAFISQHIGDLKNLAAYTSFQKTIDHLRLILQIEPELIVHDLHPGYLSTRWAVEQEKAATLGVQHHHAHLASCMAENAIDEPVIGLILDGTGYGSDGTIWGGEVLIGDYQNFTRYASLETMPLPGGDAAIAAPWRTAVAYLHTAFDGQLPDLPFLSLHDIGPILEMVEKKVNTPDTSSCGRFFDAVAALSGGRQTIAYEAQAAIELMQAADGRYDGEGSYSCGDITTVNGVRRIPVRPIIRSVAEDVADGKSLAVISRRFHQALIDLFAYVADRSSQETEIKTVALSGGVFQNRLLFEGLLKALNTKGLKVLTHSEIPTNDGCISLGQAMIGRHYILN